MTNQLIKKEVRSLGFYVSPLHRIGRLAHHSLEKKSRPMHHDSP